MMATPIINGHPVMEDGTVDDREQGRLHLPWVAEEWGPDATILRADGSRIIVGDALYHPENMETARYIVAQVAATPVKAIEAEEPRTTGTGLDHNLRDVDERARPANEPTGEPPRGRGPLEQTGNGTVLDGSTSPAPSTPAGDGRPAR